MGCTNVDWAGRRCCGRSDTAAIKTRHGPGAVFRQRADRATPTSPITQPIGHDSTASHHIGRPVASDSPIAPRVVTGGAIVAIVHRRV